MVGSGPAGESRLGIRNKGHGRGKRYTLLAHRMGSYFWGAGQREQWQLRFEMWPVAEPQTP